MKKIVIYSICVILLLVIAAAFSVNCIFDKIVEVSIIDKIDFDNLLVEESENNLKDGSVEISSEENINRGIFTPNEIKEIEEQFSIVDKSKVIKILVSKFSIEELTEMSTIVTGGINNHEFDEIKYLLKEKIDQEDVELLRLIYMKYTETIN